MPHDNHIAAFVWKSIPTAEADGNAAAKAVCIPLSLALERGQKTLCFLLFFRKKMKKFSSIETFFNTLPSSWYLPSLLEMKMMFIFLR